MSFSANVGSENNLESALVGLSLTSAKAKGCGISGCDCDANWQKFKSSNNYTNYVNAHRVKSGKVEAMSPPGWGGTVKHMVDNHPNIKNPHALAWSMYEKGDQSHKKAPKGTGAKHVSEKTAKKRSKALKKKHKVSASLSRSVRAFEDDLTLAEVDKLLGLRPGWDKGDWRKKYMNVENIEACGTKVSGYVESSVPKRCGTCEYIQDKNLCTQKDVLKDPEVKTCKETGLKIVDAKDGCCNYWDPKEVKAESPDVGIGVGMGKAKKMKAGPLTPTTTTKESDDVMEESSQAGSGKKKKTKAESGVQW
jgi:hypothetical protein